MYTTFNTTLMLLIVSGGFMWKQWFTNHNWPYHQIVTKYVIPEELKLKSERKTLESHASWIWCMKDLRTSLLSIAWSWLINGHLMMTLYFPLHRGIENYLNVKQVTQYISDEPWGWYQSPSKLWECPWKSKWKITDVLNYKEIRWEGYHVLNLICKWLNKYYKISRAVNYLVWSEWELFWADKVVTNSKLTHSSEHESAVLHNGL